MVFSMFRTLLIFFLLVAFLQLGAMRPLLDGEQWLPKDELVVQLLPRVGPAKKSGHQCANIPGREGGDCHLGGINAAGNIMHAPPAFPIIVAGFGVASTAKETQDQHKSS